MKKETYNGWTNYATWRVNLEIFNGLRPEDINGSYSVSNGELENYLEEVLQMGCENNLVLDYALAFVSNVNWYEISEHINQNK